MSVLVKKQMKLEDCYRGKNKDYWISKSIEIMGVLKVHPLRFV